MNVLSLFDGMSCGQIALNRAGIKYENYFASEIDKYAIQITQKNYPNTIQLGSVVDVKPNELPKIDLLIGGSPCQSFSFAGKRKGMSTKDNIDILTLEHYLELKEQNFEFEGQSYLFWEYMRILNEVKPKYFLLENVIMGEKWERVLSKAIGYNPIEINSSLVSGQNRKRLYWTNIGVKPSGLFGYENSIITEPKDKAIFLKDILENNVAEKYYLKSINNDRLSKTLEIHSQNLEYGTLIDSYNKSIHKEKSITISTRVNASSQTHIYAGDFRKDEGFRWRDNGKSGTLMARAREDKYGIGLLNINNTIRRLTPIECERLQTVPDNYTQGVSDAQRYKMIGNGWTVDVIAHIFSYLEPF